MRLWTLHPCYLDPQGLVALWREALLAQAVIGGATRGYRFHPQLNRFKAAPSPRGAIAAYLREVKAEADRRGYRFDASRIVGARSHRGLSATEGQLAFEWRHLRAKLRDRNPKWLARFRGVTSPDPHPLFEVAAGDVEPWERGR